MKTIFFTITMLLTAGCFEGLLSFKTPEPKNDTEKLIDEIKTLKDLGWMDDDIGIYYDSKINVNIESNIQSVNSKQVQSQNNRAKRKISSYRKPTLEEISNHSTALIIISKKLDTSSKISITGTGSGFFIEKSILVTNNHVVEKNDTIYLKTPTGKTDIGVVILRDSVNDLAILKTTKSNYKPIKFGDYSKVKLGDKVSVISSPGGFFGTLSQGIVSAKRELNNKNELQITATISHGSSGSPVLNEKLELIGISVGGIKGRQKINFAIPVTYLQNLITKNKNLLVKLNKFNVEEEIKKQELKNLQNKRSPKSQIELTRHYYQKKQYKKAFYWSKQAALQGNVIGQYNTGLMYYNGEGVRKDYSKAFDWYKQAAFQGDTIAKNNIGVMYYEGLGVDKNHVRAFHWFRKSARKGYALSQFNTGLMYYNGEGTKRNYSKAFYWFNKTSSQNHANAQYNIGVMYYKGQGVKRDYSKAFQWFNKASENGDPQAKKILRKLAAR